MFNFITLLIKVQLNKNGERFFGLILALFLFILIFNITGMLPGNFCLTSHLGVTLTLSTIIFIGSIVYMVQINGYLYFFLFFVPKNVPFLLIPFLTIIELISFISRVLSLSIRLFANMVAGHSLLNILTSSVVAGNKVFKSVDSLFLLGVVTLPIIIILAIYLLEVGVSFLQSYVFVVLSLIYLKDSIVGHSTA
jgi:ATP synthase subunit 6